MDFPFQSTIDEKTRWVYDGPNPLPSIVTHEIQYKEICSDLPEPFGPNQSPLNLRTKIFCLWVMHNNRTGRLLWHNFP
jgi:hypothetical protein